VPWPSSSRWAARAADAIDQQLQGPEIGKAPPLITAQDQSGPDRDFESLRGKRGLSLMFSRSSDW